MASTEPSTPLAIVPSPTTPVAKSPPLLQPVASHSPSNHHSFPPSPPSSCGGQSPPPKSPAGSSSPPSVVHIPIPRVALQKPLFSFSIENILRPDFGNNPRPQRISYFLPPSESGLRTPPKTPELHRNDSPVDLSQKPPQIQTKIPASPSEKLTEKPETEDKLTNTFDTSCSAANNSRIRYPENPEELANPKVPEENMVWPAWVYCTRYSDRPSSGPRSRRIKRRERNPEEKRPRTAFTSEQLGKLKVEFETNKYLDDKRRQTLAKDLNLNESQIKIWFQNKRAKDKKNVGNKNGLAQHLMAQGLYNHSTMAVDEDDPFLN